MVTLALIAHAHSFIFHDYGKALQIFERMFQLNPMQAICFDLAAVTNVYVNNKELAYEQSQLALKLGRFSPYRYCIYTTCSMAAAINHRYQEAAHYGDLATQDRFLAAVRGEVRLLGGFDGTEAASWERQPEENPTTWEPSVATAPLLPAKPWTAPWWAPARFERIETTDGHIRPLPSARSPAPTYIITLPMPA